MAQIAPIALWRSTSADDAHGGRLVQARRMFPHAPEPFVDLSTGINPVPYPIPTLAEEMWTRLPDPEAVKGLEAVAARAYGVGANADVIAVPGSQIVISLLPHLFPVASVTVLGPTYGEYARSFIGAGSRVREISHLDDIGSKTAAVVICNPNNPDGRSWTAAEILAGISRAARGQLSLIDETFMDVEEDGLSIAPSLPVPGVVLLRSLSKSFGLGGLRLGFVITDRETGARVRTALGPWQISGPAVEIGMHALSDRGWLEGARVRLAACTARLDAMLRGAGLALVGGTRLFRLVETGRADEIFTALGRSGILVRRFANHTQWLRFGVPHGDIQWQRLADAFSALNPR